MDDFLSDYPIDNLSDDLMEVAIKAYLRNQLNSHDQLIVDAISECNATIDKMQETIETFQKECHHPLLFRVHENHGNGEDMFFTQHRCHICDKYWRTTQRWMHVGTKKGLPDDEEAKFSGLGQT